MHKEMMADVFIDLQIFTVSLSPSLSPSRALSLSLSLYLHPRIAYVYTFIGVSLFRCKKNLYRFIYSIGLKLRMPHPFRSRCSKECRRGGKILKNPGKMQFSGTCNLTGSFFNESFVGKFCENLQRNMRLSATHRMPPAKSPGRSMSNI